MANISRRRGDTTPDRRIIKNNGVVQDITGYSFRMTLNTDPLPTDQTNELYQVVGQLTDAANGVLDFFPGLANVDQAPGVYFFDIQMVDPLGYIKTIEVGEYEYLQDITKETN